MTVEPLSFGSVRRSLDKALAERGEDFTYASPVEGSESCFYLTYDEYPEPINDYGDLDFAEFRAGSRGTPTGTGCLVGYVLADHGYTYEQIRTVEGNGADHAIRKLVDVADERADDILIFGLQRAQSSQDQGETWGQAVYEYDREVSQALKDAETLSEAV